MKRTLIAACIAAAIVAFNASEAQAIAIQYDTLVTDTGWRYTYTVSDFVFGANQVLYIDFDSTLYSDLQDTSPSDNAGWSTLIFPTSDLPTGSFVALSPDPGASPAEPFTVEFTWLGTGTPGAQLFYLIQLNAAGDALYQFAADGSVLTGDPGSGPTGTTQPTPEPATLGLLTMGAAIACAARRRRRQ